MRILLVAATFAEIEPFLDTYSLNPDKGPQHCGQHEIRVLLTGAGMVPTAFFLGKELASTHFDLAINCGIAGTFDHQLALGTVCRIVEDVFAELGAEDGDEFLSIDKMGFGRNAYHETYTESLLTLPDLTRLKGITVNKVHGNELTIARAIQLFHPTIESMEGAAFFYACEQCSVPALQIRSISNYVERRNKEKWDIPLAIRNLNDVLIKLLEI